MCVLSRIQLFASPWAVACQALLSMGFSRQEYWSGLPFPPPGDLPNPGMETESPVSPALAGGFFYDQATWEAPIERKEERLEVNDVYQLNLSICQEKNSFPGLVSNCPEQSHSYF